jgi:hypothetical protein
MRKHTPLTDEMMGFVLMKRATGMSYAAIALLLNRNPSTIRSFYEKYEKRHVFCAKMGRPRNITTEIEDKVVEITVNRPHSSLRQMHLSNARQIITRDNLPQSQNQNCKISRESIRGIRHKNHIHYYRTIPVPPLTIEQKQQRVHFAEIFLNNLEQFPICFTDESQIMQNLNKGGIWRRKGAITEDCYYNKTNHAPNCMVWGGIVFGVKLALIPCFHSITAMSLANLLASNRILYELNDRFGDKQWYWQMDNAPPHRPLFEVFRDQGYNIIDWPPFSPDLNPIEMMWSIVTHRLRGQEFTNANDLFNAVQQIWLEIPIATVNSLVTSFRARLEVCIRINGECLNGHWKEVHEIHCTNYPHQCPTKAVFTKSPILVNDYEEDKSDIDADSE